MAGTRSVLLVAIGAQVVVIADEALETPAPEVAFQASVTADTWGEI